MTLHSAEISVRYRLTTSTNQHDLQTALSLLSSEERGRHDRLSFEADRRDFALAHALVRTTLSTYVSADPASWRFDTGPHGKPQLAGPIPLTFNLSHTRGLVACVVSAGEDVGIDVESVDRAVEFDTIARRRFAPAELDVVRRCVPPQEQNVRFCELWTLKEAFVKGVGIGMTGRSEAGTFFVTDLGAITFSAAPPYKSDEWHFALFAPAPHQRLAIAVRSARVRFREIVARLADTGAGHALRPYALSA